MKKCYPGFNQLVSEAAQGVAHVSVAEFNERMNQDGDYILIDVREDSEWDEGHIFGAMHIGRGVLECDIERLVPDQNVEIYVYCRGGKRSILAAASLQKMGYKQVKSIDGGIDAWVAQGLEIDGRVLSAEEQEEEQREQLDQQGYLN